MIEWHDSFCGVYSLAMDTVQRGQHRILMRANGRVRCIVTDSNSGWLWSFNQRLRSQGLRDLALFMWERAGPMMDVTHEVTP